MAPIKKRTTIRSKIAAKNRPPTPTSHFPSSLHDNDNNNNNDNGTGDNSTADNETFSSSFANNKRDKRVMKHSAFMSRIEKTRPGKKVLKRGGRGNKLRTKLEGLVDALPEVEGNDDEWEGVASSDEEMTGEGVKTTTTGAKGSKEEDMLGALAGMVNVRKSIKKTIAAGDGGAAAGGGKMKMKSLKSRPGAAKRKAKLEGKEMERFARNMAQMVQPSVGGGGTEAASTAAVMAGGAKDGAQGQQTGNATSDRWAALRGFIGQTMEKNPSFGKPVA